MAGEGAAADLESARALAPARLLPARAAGGDRLSGLRDPYDRLDLRAGWVAGRSAGGEAARPGRARRQADRGRAAARQPDRADVRRRTEFVVDAADRCRAARGRGPRDLLRD